MIVLEVNLHNILRVGSIALTLHPKYSNTKLTLRKSKMKLVRVVH